MIEISEDMYEILLAMGILILAGGFFFFKTDNHIVDLLNKHYKYNQKKLSRIIAVGIWGVALSCIPVLLSEIYNRNVPKYFFHRYICCNHCDYQCI